MKFLKIFYFFENSLYGGGPIFYDFPLAKTNGKVLYFHMPRAMVFICMAKAQFGAGMAPSDLLVASSQAGPTLVAQQS
jgi:hypothetical protein